MNVASYSRFCLRAFFIVVASFNAAEHACLADDTAFGDIDQGLNVKVGQTQIDQTCCERGTYSKSFDRWVDDYVDGHDAQAEKDWAGVLRAASGAKNLNKLASSTFTRLEFLEGEKSKKLEGRGGTLAAVKATLVATEHILGPCTQSASLADYMSNQYVNSGDFTAGVVYAKKSLELKELAFGKDIPELSGSLLNLADKEFLAKDYVSARAHADRALVFAAKLRSGKDQYQARILLSKLAKVKSATQR